MIAESHLLRLTDVIGNRRRGIPGIFPVSKTTWYEGIRAGRYPAPVKLGPRAVAWRASDIAALVSSAEH